MIPPDRAAPRYARVRIDADRQVTGQVPLRLLAGEVGRAAPRLAVLLDRAMIGTIPLHETADAEDGDAGDGAFHFAFPLPAHRLGWRLDLLRLSDGASVLAAPLPLAPHHRLRLHAYGWGDPVPGARRRVAGAFSLAGHFDPTLHVEIAAGEDVFGRGFAERGADGLYRFSIALARLAPLGAPSVLRPIIAGAAYAAELPLAAAEMQLAGYVEGVDEGAVRGWAADLARPDQALEMRLLEDGLEVARALADQPRPDLAKVGLGAGRGGFALPYAPRRLAPRANAPQLAVTLAESGLALVGSPFPAPTLPGFTGRFERIEEGVAIGWAVDLTDPATDPPLALEIEITSGREVIASGRADLPRADVVAAGLAGRACGFRLPLPLNAASLLARPFDARLAGTDHVLAGSPQSAHANPAITAFIAASRRPLPEKLGRRLARRLARRIEGLRLSFIMTVHNPRPDWLAEALDSVRGQSVEAFELIAVDDASTDPEIARLLGAAAGADPRVTVLRTRRQRGFGAALARGVRAAQGTHVAFLDHDDALTPHAAFHLLAAAAATEADLVLADAALSDETLDAVTAIVAGTAFSHDAFLAARAMFRPLLFTARLARAALPPDRGIVGAEEAELILRAVERARAIAHLPRVLYRKRRHLLGRAAALGAAREEARRGAVARHLARSGLAATVHPGLVHDQCALSWPEAGGEILVIVARDGSGRGDALAENLAASAGTRPYRVVECAADPAARNQALRRAGRGAHFVLFLDEAIEPLGTAWLARLVSLAARPGIGAASPLLLTPDDQVREAGWVLGGALGAAPAFSGDEVFLPQGGGLPDRPRNPGPGGLLTLTRDIRAASASALMLPRAAFEAVGGFSSELGSLAALDLGLRLRARTFRMLACGLFPLRHHGARPAALPPGELGALETRWPGLFATPDPFYSPLFSSTRADFRLTDDPAICHGESQPRMIRPPW